MNSAAIPGRGGRGAEAGDTPNIPVQFDLFNVDFAVDVFQGIIANPLDPYWKARWSKETPAAVATLLRLQSDDVLESFSVWALTFQRAAIAELRRRGK